MPFYHPFQSPRTTAPDVPSLTATLRGLDPTADPQPVRVIDGVPTLIVKKATSWTAPQIAAAQNAIDSAPAQTDQRDAQSAIDSMDLATKALALALIDQLNVLRAALPTPLGAITPAQAITAIRAKAGTL